uniref:non-specific serine/threonine protein kinase n=1 Tax=Zea mays TaxID=4577 RepID=A0A804RJC1_MAIZE
MTKARRLGVPTPVLYDVDPVLHTLTFEHVDGLPVKDILLRFGLDGVNEERLNDIATQIGNAIGKLHDGGLVHGDLTMSNMMIKNSNNQLVAVLQGSDEGTIANNKKKGKAVRLLLQQGGRRSHDESISRAVAAALRLLCRRPLLLVVALLALIGCSTAATVHSCHTSVYGIAAAAATATATRPLVPAGSG